MSGCAVMIEGFPCGQPGQMYFLGCEHEHGGKREVCDWHAGMIAGNIWCELCRESSEPHECLVSLTPAGQRPHRASEAST